MNNKGYTLISVLKLVLLLAVIFVVVAPFLIDLADKYNRITAKTRALVFLNNLKQEVNYNSIYGDSSITSIEYDEKSDEEFPVDIILDQPEYAYINIIDNQISGSIIIKGYDFTIINNEIYFTDELKG